MGLLGKLFGSNKEETHFRDRVLKLFSSEQDLHPGDHPLQVLLAGAPLDLMELYQKCQFNEVQSEDLIRQYFSFPLAFARSKKYSWHDAQLLVRPQLVPSKIAAPFQVFTLPFAGPIAASIAVKEHDQQIYVRFKDLEEWNVRPEELLNTAIVNLNSDQAEMEITVTDGTDRFIGLETHDGFDAARILLPKVREFAVQKLGAKYYAGIPNRNFLILWSPECSPRFQDYAIEKIETDFTIQNYPLSSSVFVVENDSIVER